MKDGEGAKVADRRKKRKGKKEGKGREGKKEKKTQPFTTVTFKQDTPLVF